MSLNSLLGAITISIAVPTSLQIFTGPFTVCRVRVTAPTLWRIGGRGGQGHARRSHRRFRARDGADPTAVRSGSEQIAVADGRHHGRCCGSSGAHAPASVVAAPITGLA